MGAIIRRIWASSWIGFRFGSSKRKHKPGAALVLLLVCAMVASLGCGLIGGDDEPAEEGSARRAQLLTEVEEGAKATAEAASADNSEGDAAADEAAAPETEVTPDSQAEAEATPDTDTTAEAPTDEVIPAAATLVENEEQARNLAWAHISQCINFASAELEATLITGAWFVKGKDQASRDYGFWKIPSATAMVTPHDAQARKWESAVESKCSADTMKSVPSQVRVVADAAGAGAAVWSYLVPCISGLSTELFQSVFDPAEGQWTVVIAPEYPEQMGTWVVNPDTGEITPHNEIAGMWASAVSFGCTAEVVKPLLQPTPVPPPTPAVSEISAAVTNLWFYLVKCGPGLTVADLQATWNPVKNEWMVITAPETTVDYGVWTVRPDGGILPSNQESRRREQLSLGGAC